MVGSLVVFDQTRPGSPNGIEGIGGIKGIKGSQEEESNIYPVYVLELKRNQDEVIELRKVNRLKSRLELLSIGEESEKLSGGKGNDRKENDWKGNDWKEGEITRKKNCNSKDITVEQEEINRQDS